MKRKEEEEEEEEEEKEQADLTSLVVGRTTSDGGAADVVVLDVNIDIHWPCPFGGLNLHRQWGGRRAFFLSLDLTQPSGGEEDERWWGGGRGSATPALSFQRPIDPPALSSISLSLSDV